MSMENCNVVYPSVYKDLFEKSLEIMFFFSIPLQLLASYLILFKSTTQMAVYKYYLLYQLVM